MIGCGFSKPAPGMDIDQDQKPQKLLIPVFSLNFAVTFNRYFAVFLVFSTLIISSATNDIFKSFFLICNPQFSFLLYTDMDLQNHWTEMIREHLCLFSKFRKKTLNRSPLCAKLLQLCLTLCNPMDCSPPGFSVPEISQARILECVAISYSWRSSTQGSKPSLLHWQEGSLPLSHQRSP